MLGDRSEKRATDRVAVPEDVEVTFISQEAMDAWVSSWDKDLELPAPETDVHIASQRPMKLRFLPFTRSEWLWMRTYYAHIFPDGARPAADSMAGLAVLSGRISWRAV